MSTSPATAVAPTVQTDTTELSTVYTNFCRVSVTPEELILDFGLNTQITPQQQSDPVMLSHRVVMNFYTAKRLMGALMNVISQYENAYGMLELDFQRRARPQPRPGTAPTSTSGTMKMQEVRTKRSVVSCGE